MNALEKFQALAEIDKALRMKQAGRARKDLFTFFKYFAWPVLLPNVEFRDNWHIRAVCEHLQAISEGQINRLIVNIPFRMLKSTLISQAWPAWEWIEQPQTEWLTASYAKDLSIRDAVASRSIIQSDLYRECFGDSFTMTSDQNVKSRYQNSRGGKRYAASTESAATGFGGNRMGIDDPLSALEADSDVAREHSIEWFKGTFSTRFNDPAKDSAVVTHQRLHQMDLTGWLLKHQPEVWEHLILPMRYESKRIIMIGGMQQEVPTKEAPSRIGYVDPRTVEGELLHPDRLSDETVKIMESTLGAYHTSAQLQQRPDNRGGTIFKRKFWKFYSVLPTFDEVVISVDCAFKDTDESDFVAIQVIGRKGADKYLIKRIKERMGFGATVAAVRSTRALYPSCIAVLIEDKANGTAVIETIKHEIAGVLPIEPVGGKVARAYAVQPQHEAGNFYLPDPTLDPTIEMFLSEMDSFPNGINDDEVDGWTQGVNWYMLRERGMGIFELYKQDAAALAAQQEIKAQVAQSAAELMKV